VSGPELGQVGPVELTGRFQQITALRSGVAFCDFTDEATGRTHEVVCFRAGDPRLFARMANREIRPGVPYALVGEWRENTYGGVAGAHIVARVVYTRPTA
jgi:hypothetical protein